MGAKSTRRFILSTSDILIVVATITAIFLLDSTHALMATSSPSSRVIYGKDDALFGSIEEMQGDRPFGSFLDAGTGMHSLRWIASLRQKGMTDFCAITADENMQRQVQMEADALGVEDYGRILAGNWFASSKFGPALELHQQFDTILADYLIGAMDGFSPYRQEEIIPILSKYLKPSGRLYIVGLEPLPDEVAGPANVICKVRQARDACILLAGHRCYREYPQEWMQRQLNLCDSLQLLDSSSFPILYRHDTIVKQINVGRSKLQFFDNKQLVQGMKELLDDLDTQALHTTQSSGGRIQLGFDYVIAAEKIN
jgi:hypothetical protein